MRVVSLLAPAAGIVAAAALLVSTRGLDEVAQAGQLGPGFWPRVVLVSLLLACAARLVEEWRRAPGSAGVTTPERGTAVADDTSWRGLGIAVGLLLLYVAATPVLGFMLATIGFIAAFMWHAGARSPAGMLGSAVAGTVALLYVFVKVVYLPLPKGAGPVEDVTIAAYRLLGIF